MMWTEGYGGQQCLVMGSSDPQPWGSMAADMERPPNHGADAAQPWWAACPAIERRCSIYSRGYHPAPYTSGDDHHFVSSPEGARHLISHGCGIPLADIRPIDLPDDEGHGMVRVRPKKTAMNMKVTIRATDPKNPAQPPKEAGDT